MRNFPLKLYKYYVVFKQRKTIPYGSLEMQEEMMNTKKGRYVSQMNSDLKNFLKVCGFWEPSL